MSLAMSMAFGEKTNAKIPHYLKIVVLLGPIDAPLTADCMCTHTCPDVAAKTILVKPPSSPLGEHSSD